MPKRHTAREKSKDAQAVAETPEQRLAALISALESFDGEPPTLPSSRKRTRARRAAARRADGSASVWRSRVTKRPRCQRDEIKAALAKAERRIQGASRSQHVSTMWQSASMARARRSGKRDADRRAQGQRRRRRSVVAAPTARDPQSLALLEARLSAAAPTRVAQVCGRCQGQDQRGRARAADGEQLSAGAPGRARDLEASVRSPSRPVNRKRSRNEGRSGRAPRVLLQLLRTRRSQSLDEARGDCARNGAVSKPTLAAALKAIPRRAWSALQRAHADLASKAARAPTPPRRQPARDEESRPRACRTGSPLLTRPSLKRTRYVPRLAKC